MRNFPSRLSHSIDKNGMWYVLLRPSLHSSLSFHTSKGRESLAGVDRMTSYSSSLRKFWGSLRGTTPEGVQFVVKGEFAAEAKARCLCSHPRAGFLLLSLCAQHPPGDQSHRALYWWTLPSASLLSYCPEPRVLTHLSSTSILWSQGVSSTSVTSNISLCWDDPSLHDCFVAQSAEAGEFCRDQWSLGLSLPI